MSDMKPTDQETAEAVEPQADAATQRRRRLRTHLLRALVITLVVAGVSTYLVFDLVIINFRTVVDDEVYRSAQPSMHRAETWVKEYDIKTIINLRGTSQDIVHEEEALVEPMGVEMHHFRLSKRRPPPRDAFLGLLDLMDNAPRPMLIHCLQGYDRSGFVSFLAAWRIGGRSYEDAKEELAIAWRPWKPDPSHINDTLEWYEAWCAKESVDPDNWDRFCHWAKTVYQEPDRSTPQEGD